MDKYTELEKQAQRFLDETDTMQFSTVELLTMFYNHQEQLTLTSVVGSLPNEDERDLEKDRVRDIILKEIPDLDRVSFGSGFRACFSWFTKRYTK